MGRYVTGNFDYKFAFGDQSSSFGEVLELLCKDTENDVTRYISNVGEIVKLHLCDGESLLKNIKEFTTEFKPMTEEQENMWSKCNIKMGDSYWNQFMMLEFAKQLELETFDDDIELTFDVEY
jgi:hypothetical protein